MQRTVALIFLMVVTMPIFAATQRNSIVGEWYSFDHKSRRPSALIKVQRTAKNTFKAVFEKIYDAKTGRVVERCKTCVKAYQKRKVNGLPLILGLEHTGESYRHGRILDPRVGKWYHVSAKLAHEGNWLRLHAYVLVPLLGRTEVLVRKG